jgi:hypothetical protein
VQVRAGVYTRRHLVLLRCFGVFDLLKVRGLLEVQQVQRGAKGESSGIEGISAEVCYCMVCMEIPCFEYLNLERCVCHENCESHEMREMREIREGHDVKSSKRLERVVLLRVPRLNMKSLRIEQMVQHENGLPIVVTVHKCSYRMHTEGGSFTNTKFIRQETGLIYCTRRRCVTRKQRYCDE